MTLDELNGLPLTAFIEECEPLLEHCDWVLPILGGLRPFVSLNDMQKKLELSISTAPKRLQKRALQMHPKLGVGKAQPGFSQSEQKQAGLANLTEEELLLFKELNRRYEEKMGYPFVIAVTGLGKTEILERMASRSEESAELEWLVSVAELIKIAQIRVAKLFDQ